MNTKTNHTKHHTPTIVLAWSSVLLLSILPNVLFDEFGGGTPDWLYLAKLGVLVALMWLSIVWEPARRLRTFYLAFLGLFLLEELFLRVGSWSRWQAWFTNQGFVIDQLGIQLRVAGVALAMLGLLASLGLKRREFFLRLGDLDEPAPPMPVFGFNAPTSWKRQGLLLGAGIGLAVMAAFGLTLRPEGAAWAALLPLFPMVLVLAAMNAFGEEVSYRAALLGPAYPPLGGRQAVWLTAAFFGISHYFGAPYGVIGVVLFGLFGWVLGTVMLNSKGLLWPWFIHFVVDVVIFSFIAMGAVTPGGG